MADQHHRHEGAHEHSHEGGHEHSREQSHVPALGAVLDIGGTVGALLVQTDDGLDGAEIELYDEQGGYVMHTEVHGREVSGSRRYAGLFPAVEEGTYLLDVRDGSARERVVVVGAQVTTVERVRVSAV
jgi:hypothetical protein